MKTFRLSLMATAICCAALSVAQAEPGDAPPGSPPQVPANLLRLHGSNTIGAQLGPDLFLAFGRQKKLDTAHEEPGAQAEERTLVLQGAENANTLHGEIFAHGSGTAFVDLLGGKTDIGMSSRPITAEEVGKLRDAGVGQLMTKPGNENVIALDGITFLVHKSNLVKALSIAQLHDLMTGAKTNWSEVGGPNLPVHIYSRDEKSGTFDLVREHIIGKGSKLSASAKLFESSEDLSDSVAADPSGLGFTGFAYVRNARSIPIAAACALPPSEPSVFLVKNEEYPLARRLFLYVGDKPSALAQDFLKFALSSATNTIAEHAGFVSLEPTLGTDQYTQAMLARPPVFPMSGAEMQAFQSLARGAQRLSITFRFDIGRSTLDSKAEADLARLRDWARDQGKGRTIILVGHASGDGIYVGNVALSQRRAAEVAGRLAALGVSVSKTIAVGPAVPVVCDGKPEDANLNRRVEVWVR